MSKLDKSLIKVCGNCGMLYYGNESHLEKSSKCLDLAMAKFRKDNDIPSYEVWHSTFYMDDHMWAPQYDHEATQRNFMKLIYNRNK